MKQKRSPFFAYRYFIMPINQQTSILHHQGKTKEELVKDIFDKIHSEHKTTHEARNKKYLFYGIIKHSKDLYVIKLAKESTSTLYKEGELDLEEQKSVNLKFIYIFVNTKRQILLIERKSTAFPKYQSAINVIRELLCDRMRQHDYTVNISPLSSSKRFWDYVENADQIFELNLKLNAPNMLFGNEPIRDALGDIKSDFNNDEVEFSVRSRDGVLKLLKKVLGTAIEYIGTVGGGYQLKYAKNGKEDTVSNSEHIKKTYIVKRQDDNYNNEDLQNVIDKIEIIHNTDLEEL